MRGLRIAVRFCQTKSYINKFDCLETEVNKLEREVIAKKEEIRKIKEVTSLSALQFLQKELMKMASQPYEYQNLGEVKSRIKELQSELVLRREDGDQRLKAANKLKQAEQENAELIFLTDLARFSRKYQQFIKTSQLGGDIKQGIELSHQALNKVLKKDNVEWVGIKEEVFNPSIHDRVEGSSQVVKQVVEKGFKIKGQIIDKAKIK